MILNFVFMFRGYHAQQRADHNRNDLAQQYQNERYFHLLGKHRADREILRKGVSEIALQRVFDIDQQLPPDGKVQTELCFQLRNVFIRRRFACKNCRRIAGRKMNHQEADTDNCQNDGNHLQDSPENILSKFHFLEPLPFFCVRGISSSFIYSRICCAACFCAASASPATSASKIR